MKLNVREQTDILKGFPKFELSYETLVHNKVLNNNIILLNRFK